MGDVEVAYLFLKDVNLKPCTGCYACLANGEDKCPLKDDRAAIEQMLLAADGVILSSPMYVLNVSWLMKNLIDRFAYTNHRPRFHLQKVLTVVNMGGDHPKAVLSFLRSALGGSRLVHELGIATPPWPQTQRAVAKKERAIDAAAEKLYRPVWTRPSQRPRCTASSSSLSGSSSTSNAGNICQRTTRSFMARRTIAIREYIPSKRQRQRPLLES